MSSGKLVDGAVDAPTIGDSFIGAGMGDRGSRHQLGIADLPRAVLSAAFGMIDTAQRVVAGDKVRTARDNAWEAVCADRARADHRAEVRRHVAMIVTMPMRRPAAPTAFVPAPAERQVEHALT